MKHVERPAEINKLRNVASCWLYCANILAMHGHVNVKFVAKKLSNKMCLTGNKYIYIYTYIFVYLFIY